MNDFLVLLVAGVFGLVMHWLKRWARKQTDNNFWQYMTLHKKHSIASLTSLFAVMAGLISTVDVVLGVPLFATAFLAGYTIDSAVNK
mgnify:CR=1 FL=1